MKALFLRDPAKPFVQVLLGLVDKDDPASTRLVLEGTDAPDRTSNFKAVLKFDARLIRAFRRDGVATVSELMDNVPLFCLNRGFRKICWEELHEPMAKDARFLKL